MRQVFPDGSTGKYPLQGLSDTTDYSLGVSLIGGAGRVVDSVAILRSLPKTGVPNVFLTSYYGDGKGGVGPIYYDASDTTSSDNGGTIFVATDGGRWKRPLAAVSVQDFGAKGDGITDDTTAFNNWLAWINTSGQHGYISATSSYYSIPNGLTISGFVNRKITADPQAKITTTQVIGYAITLTNCLYCDFDFGYVTAGYSGILIQSSVANATDNKVRWNVLQGAGRQATKPADPMANRIGVYVQGPTLGNANYYNTLGDGGYINGFDTCYALYTPAAVGAMNANANFIINPRMEGWWFGIYTNSVENLVVGARWFASGGQDASHLAECVRVGDGSFAANFNYIQGVAEPGDLNTQAYNCLVNSLNNIIIIQDNCDYGGTDSGNNQTWTRNTWSSGAAVTMRGGLTLGAPSGIDTETIAAAAGHYAVNIDASAAGAQGLKIKGSGAGNPSLVLNSQATTGAATPTLGTNKPGINSTPAAWIPVVVDGATLYIPAWN